MGFRVEITEEYTMLKGRKEECLIGLAMYIEALLKNGISKDLIKKAINIVLEENKEDVSEDKAIKVQKIDLNGMSKEEAKEMLEKEIFNKLFD